MSDGWTCRKCTLINPLDKSVCSVCSCSQLYSETNSSSTPVRNVPNKSQTDGVWSCSECTLLNPHSSSKCKACRTPQTPLPASKVYTCTLFTARHVHILKVSNIADWHWGGNDQTCSSSYLILITCQRNQPYCCCRSKLAVLDLYLSQQETVVVQLRDVSVQSESGCPITTSSNRNQPTWEWALGYPPPKWGGASSLEMAADCRFLPEEWG